MRSTARTIVQRRRSQHSRPRERRSRPPQAAYPLDRVARLQAGSRPLPASKKVACWRVGLGSPQANYPYLPKRRWNWLLRSGYSARLVLQWDRGMWPPESRSCSVVESQSAHSKQVTQRLTELIPPRSMRQAEAVPLLPKKELVVLQSASWVPFAQPQPPELGSMALQRDCGLASPVRQ